MPDQKEPFVPKEDRPETKLPEPDQPISELRVRDLQAILGQQATLKKNEFKELKFEKAEHKELKNEKIEIKEFKHEKPEHKDFKIEKIEIKEFKHEKPEHKDLKIEKFEKHEKIEIDPVQKFPDVIEDPTKGPTPDPQIGVGLDRVIQLVAGLTKRVEELANQVAELQKRGK
ncbi:MAG TPA: hypothetical protein VKC34_05115 [Blastocatellia bacterium]|nr:hypothetical protein [Blastocatellia bacterium]